MSGAFKKLTFPCAFQGVSTQNVDFYIGNPKVDSHPIGFQMKWVGEKGGNVPPNVASALERIKAIAIKHNIPYADLCEYIIMNMNS